MTGGISDFCSLFNHHEIVGNLTFFTPPAGF